jgi:F-type H+-transporting ATPase subunit a
MSIMHSPLEQFKIKKIIPLELLGYDISFTNSSLMMVIILAIIAVFAVITTRKPSLIPGRLQVVGEAIYGLAHDMVASTCGTKGERFVPFIMTLFLFILTANLLGMIPGSFTVTSHIAVTFGLAAFIFICVTIIGFIVQLSLIHI